MFKCQYTTKRVRKMTPKQTDLQFWIDSYQFWRKAIGTRNGFASMYRLNIARKNLAKAIRQAEKKLGRKPRTLPHLGCVQYIGAK
jgi:hypothetical protein